MGIPDLKIVSCKDRGGGGALGPHVCVDYLGLKNEGSEIFQDLNFKQRMMFFVTSKCHRIFGISINKRHNS